MAGLESWDQLRTGQDCRGKARRGRRGMFGSCLEGCGRACPSSASQDLFGVDVQDGHCSVSRGGVRHGPA